MEELTKSILELGLILWICGGGLVCGIEIGYFINGLLGSLLIVLWMITIPFGYLFIVYYEETRIKS